MSLKRVIEAVKEAADSEALGNIPKRYPVVGTIIDGRFVVLVRKGKTPCKQKKK